MTSVSSIATQKRLEGKVAIITGGASGIGASAVHIFHQNGAKVVIADIQDSLGQALADKLGENVSYIHCDVSNEVEVSSLVDTTVAKYGKLDIMYNNAGILGRPYGDILGTTKSELESVIAVNMVGSFNGAKQAARVMIPQQEGCILFTTSACTQIGGLATQAYAMTKYAIMGLTKNLASELGQYGIRVNCVAPYATVTGLTEEVEEIAEQVEAFVSGVGNLKGKVLKAEDVARAALYLASDEANYVSGLNLVVDGGYSIINPSLMNGFNLQIKANL